MVIAEKKESLLVVILNTYFWHYDFSILILQHQLQVAKHFHFTYNKFVCRSYLQMAWRS